MLVRHRHGPLADGIAVRAGSITQTGEAEKAEWKEGGGHRQAKALRQKQAQGGLEGQAAGLCSAHHPRLPPARIPPVDPSHRLPDQVGARAVTSRYRAWAHTHPLGGERGGWGGKAGT